MDLCFGVTQPLYFVSKLTGFVNLGNIFSFLKLPFPCLQNGDNKTCPQGDVRIHWYNVHEPYR